MFTRNGLAQLALVVALLAAMLLTFPGDYQPVSPGLDASWVWGLNAFTTAGFRFGRDLIFTYGPLGYMIRPLDVGPSLGRGLMLRLVVHVAIFGCLILLLVRGRRPRSLAFFLAGFLLLAAFGLEFDYQILVAAAFVLALAIELRITSLLAVPSAVCAALILMRFGTGVSGLAMTVAGAISWWWRWRTTRGPMVLLGSYLIVIAWLGNRVFGSLAGTATFLRLSAEIARGYNDTMSSAGPVPAVLGGLLVLVGATGLTLVLSRRLWPSSTVLQVLALPILLGFKHSFVRQDWGHEPFLFGIALAGLVVALAFASRWAELRVLGVAALGVVGVFVATADQRAVDARRAALGAVVTGASGRSQLAALLHWNTTRAGLAEASRRTLETQDSLPGSWRERIGGQSVMVVPSELALCAANRLACVPYPTLQMYSTYTRALDRWTADRLAASPPEWVIAEVGAIDGRNMVWDCPETWLTLIRGWDVVAASRQPDRLLLGRRGVVRPESEEALGRTRARLGEWSPAPPVQGRVRLGVDVHSTVLGALRRTFFREGPVLLDIAWADGRQSSFRLVIDTARAGVLVSPVVTNTRELADLFDESKAPVAPRAVRIRAGGGGWWKRDVDLAWVSLHLGAPTGSEERP